MNRLRATTRVLVSLAATCLLAGLAPPLADEAAGDAPQATGLTGEVVVELVSDFTSNTLVSELERFMPIIEPVLDAEGRSSGQVATLGTEAHLWVRNAHVSGRFFFERYYQGKYIGREARIRIPAAELGAGEHVIEPGAHRFTLEADGTLHSEDPEIAIEARTVRLRLHRIGVHAVDGAREGPAAFRLVPAELGVFAMQPEARLDPASLPRPDHTHNPRTDGEREAGERAPLINLVSHQHDFHPLYIWLPANTVGQGYVLFPSWQAFHVTADGTVGLSAATAPKVPGVTSDGGDIVIPYRTFSGRIATLSRLAGGVANVPISERMQLGATLSPLHFRAGVATPPEGFHLPVNNDFSHLPHKAFVADNTQAIPEAVRLMVLEWQSPIFARGDVAEVSLRLLESDGLAPIGEPVVRMQWSPHNPSLPTYRDWRPVEVLGWNNGRERGEMSFRAPDDEAGFGHFRMTIDDAEAAGSIEELTTGLWCEMSAALVDAGTTGSASFAANRGRNAFVAGEDIHLTLVLRSHAPRPAGQRTLVLTRPDGSEETLDFTDDGGVWTTVDLLFPGVDGSDRWPGRYRLGVRGLPAGMVSHDFAFDLVGRDRRSLYHVVKASKYTRGMSTLEVGHMRGEPQDLDRAMRSIAELGYNRVDLMTYLTQRHRRYYRWRETLAERDPRLPSEATVFAPSPRNQIINACVREGMQFSDVWLSYNDFHLPRYIEPYIRASERWIAREMQDMRYAPAFDGLMLYDEMYETAVSGLVDAHQNIFGRMRAAAAEAALGMAPSQIEAAFSRYLRRPAGQRNPEPMLDMIGYRNWQQKGWADYVDRVVDVARRLKPDARFGTFKRTFAAPDSNNDGLTHGYAPDLFRNLDIVSHVHYADNSTGWVNVPSMARILRTGKDKLLYVNQPLTHEIRSRSDGQYTRMMAFALLSHGANGISQYGLPQQFDDGPSKGMLQGRETLRWLHESLLLPFGELIDRTVDGDRSVAIVSTHNQHALQASGSVPATAQIEGIWIACHRLGYPASFLREEHADEPFADFEVIFVPGVRFEGQLDERVERRLREALAAGVRVVVEQGSALDLPGLTRLEDQRFDSVYFGTYFATWLDDELNKVYEKTQPIVDYLRPRLEEWGAIPAARGEFTQGPTWRDGGDVQYLVMANFDNPDYGHAVKQIMARPRLTELRLAASRGAAAYDLLRQEAMELTPAGAHNGREEVELELDMRRIQGALVAFTPEPVDRFEIDRAVANRPARLRLQGRLFGVSGAEIDGVFPVRIVIARDGWRQTYYRVMGNGLAVELDVPRGAESGTVDIDIREALSGRTVRFDVPLEGGGSGLTLLADAQPFAPYPHEVEAFIEGLDEVVIVASPFIEGADGVAASLAERMRERGVDARLASEGEVYRLPGPDPSREDPYMDGYHSWRGGGRGVQEVVGPPVVVDQPLILLGGRNSLFLVDLLTEYGSLTWRPLGRPGQSTRPLIQVATKGFNIDHDTLCLLANDATGLARAVDALWALPAAETPSPSTTYGPSRTLSDDGHVAIATAGQTLDTNEMPVDMAFDAAGNLYVITWGHGDNLFSYTPDGQRRFSQHLPEMGANRLQVAGDRLLVHTAAGARVYQLTLDGRPISQARLNMDPGSGASCDSYTLATTDFHYHPASGWLFHKEGDRMRAFDDAFKLMAEWSGTAFEDRDVTDETMHRQLHGYAFSPDGRHIAQLEASWYFTRVGHEDERVYDTHLVIRDLEGRTLHAFDNLDNALAVRARVEWPDGWPGPVVQVDTEWWVFDEKLELVERRLLPPSAYRLGPGGARLVRDGRHLVYIEGLDRVVSRLGPFETMPTETVMSADRVRIATLDEYGKVQVFLTADGTREHVFHLPQLGTILRFTPDGNGLVLGAVRSRIMAFDLDGNQRWEDHLADANDWIGGDIPLYDEAFPDATETIWPVGRDAPGDIEGNVRLGENRLLHRSASEDGRGWEGDFDWHPSGPSGERAMLIGEAEVSQSVAGFLGEHATWILDFHYRAAGDEPVELMAGLMVRSRHPDATVLSFTANGAWRFGRVVIKSGAAPESLTAGFVASGGEAIVDGVHLRRIRFPSVNHMLYRPFHDVNVVVLDNPLYAAAYDPFGGLREEAPNRVVVPPIMTGALNLLESTYLQNGRLNNLTSQWYIQPFGWDSSPRVSLSFSEPRWISMVALYFNAYDRENTTPHFDVLVENLDTGEMELAAEVRHNAQLMRLVTFDPIRTSLITIRLVNSIARVRTLTEVEAYGPLSGRDGPAAFLDPEGQNAYMGDFSRVDRRLKRLATDFHQPLERRLGHGAGVRIWSVPTGQVLADAGGAHLPRAFGVNHGFELHDPLRDLYWLRSGGPGYTPHGALYAGLLLRSGLDGSVSCFDPGSGQLFWRTRLGERLFGGPVAVGDDLFVANDTDRLYRLDLADGGVLGEARLSSGVRGSPATDGERIFLITHDDGVLHAYSVDGLERRWSLDIAPWTDSTPAVYAGVVYLADQRGVARAVDAATGAEIWRRELGQEFTRCPVVVPDTVREAYRLEDGREPPAAVLFGCREGGLFALDRASGEILWQRQTDSRFLYEPLILEDQALFEDGGRAWLASLHDGAIAPLTWTGERDKKENQWEVRRPQHSFSYYRGNLYVVPRLEHTGLQRNFAWHHQGGTFTVLRPNPAVESDRSDAK